MQVLSAVRGNQRVTTDNPESTYDALKKYGQDLVEAARANKLDPVIGRDSEIRNVIRILSRKRKNNPVLIGEAGVGKTASTTQASPAITATWRQPPPTFPNCAARTRRKRSCAPCKPPAT